MASFLPSVLAFPARMLKFAISFVRLRLLFFTRV